MKLPLATLLACALFTACQSETKNDPEFEAFKQKIRGDLVFVEGGSFKMGDAGYIDENGQRQYYTHSDNNKVVRTVTLSSYYISKYEATYKEFDFYTSTDKLPAIEFPNKSPELPAEGMTWYEAQKYCQWLGKILDIPMDLPTEAQWEYAARSRGLDVAYATDNGQAEEGRNIDKPDGVLSTKPPGSFPPNPLGLYDMSGNVNEWTKDWYIGAFPFEDEVDPQGPDEALVKRYRLKDKVTRGNLALGIRTIIYKRFDTKPDNTGQGVGVRCVANTSEPLK